MLELRWLALLALAVAALLFPAPATAQRGPQSRPADCGHCPPYWCEGLGNIDRMIEEKKREARAEGVPERLLALYDRLPRCEACIRTQGVVPAITVVYDEEKVRAKYGISRRLTERAWTRQREKSARDDMRSGLVKEIHIHLGGLCNCCKRTFSLDRFRAWQERPVTRWGDPEWPDDSPVDRRAPGVHFTGVGDLGPDPDDLSIPPRGPRTTLRDPGQIFVQKERIIHVTCAACQPLADQYNDIVRELNGVLDRFARVYRQYLISQDAADAAYEYLEQAETVADTDAGRAAKAQAAAQVEAREAAVADWRAQLATLRQRIADLRARLAPVRQQIRECEERCTQERRLSPPAPPQTVVSSPRPQPPAPAPSAPPPAAAPGAGACLTVDGRTAPASGSSVRAGGLCFELSASGGAEMITLPRHRFLAREVVGGAVREFGLFQPEREQTGFTLQGAARVDLTEIIDLSFGQLRLDSFARASVRYSRLEASQNAGPIDPGAGHLLLIPGPLGGASGFALGFNPLNIVTDARWAYDYSEVATKFDLGVSTNLGGSRISTYLGLDYASNAQNELFWGAITGFGRDFRYDFQADVEKWGVHIGVEGRTPIATIPGASQADFWDVALRYAGEFSGFRLNGSGQDSLAFTGFPTSIIDLDKSKSDWGALLKGGIEIRSPSGAGAAYIEGGWERRPGFAVAFRNGDDPTRLGLKAAEVAFISGGLRVQFAPR